VDEPMTETHLCAMKFPNSMKLIFDPNVWIIDTGATVHAPPNPSDMVNKSEKKCNDSVTMGYRENEVTEWYGDLYVTFCGMEGNVKGDSKMTHVIFVPTSKFNLFSPTIMMINKWILGGDKKQHLASEVVKQNRFRYQDNNLNWCYLLCLHDTQY
jgi:hypothetical protein